MIRVVARGRDDLSSIKSDESLADLFYRIAPDARDFVFIFYRNGDFFHLLKGRYPRDLYRNFRFEQSKNRLTIGWKDTIRVVEKGKP